MTTNSLTVKLILSRPWNESWSAINSECYNGLERKQYGLESTHSLLKFTILLDVELLPGPPHPPKVTTYMYGDTGEIIRHRSGPGGRHSLTSCLENDVNVGKNVSLVPSILQILKKVYGEEVIMGVFNCLGTKPERVKPIDDVNDGTNFSSSRMLSRPSHHQNDTSGQCNGFERKENKQNKGDKTDISVF